MLSWTVSAGGCRRLLPAGPEDKSGLRSTTCCGHGLRVDLDRPLRPRRMCEEAGMSGAGTRFGVGTRFR